MNKVFLRKVEKNSLGVGYGKERLDLNVEQEDKKFRHCSFTFSSQVQGIANVDGHISFQKTSSEPTALTHSSGTITSESMGNFNAFDALLSRLETLCITGLPKSDEQILNDDRVQQILKNNGFKSLESIRTS